MEDMDQFITHIQNHGCPDSKLHGANMGPIWGRQDPGGPHVGPINIAIWVLMTMHEAKASTFIELT